jgi:hypothetical protein
MLTVFAMFGWFCIGVGSRHLVSVLRKPKLVQKYVKGDKVWVRFGGGSYTAEIWMQAMVCTSRISGLQTPRIRNVPSRSEKLKTGLPCETTLKNNACGAVSSIQTRTPIAALRVWNAHNESFKGR